jgi:hypothetical protein
VDPVPGPLILRKSGSARNRTQTSGSVGRNSDHWTTEAVEIMKTSVSIVISEDVLIVRRVTVRVIVVAYGFL